MFEGMRVYIERNGRPFNYLSSVRSLNRKREDALDKEETNRDEETAASEANEASDAQKEKDRLVALQDGRMDSIINHMRELKSHDKLNMRQFLMKAIIPVLTEGMIDVWRVQCTDPVDYLADYIFKKSNDLRAKEKATPA
jgi:adenylate kinase